MISIAATHDLRDKEPIVTNKQIEELIHISESPKNYYTVAQILGDR
jgi:hypothetical protein